jgi:hypothetical protein
MGQGHFKMDRNSEIRFLAPVSWRGRVRTSEVRRLVLQYRGEGLGADPGPGQFQAKVLLNGERVRRLAEASGHDVSGFLRRLLAPRMPPAPIRRSPAMAARAARRLHRPGRPAVPQFRSAALTDYVIPKQTGIQTETRSASRSLPRPDDERKIISAYCSQCGGWREGIMDGVPSRFRCLTCGGS